MNIVSIMPARFAVVAVVFIAAVGVSSPILENPTQSCTICHTCDRPTTIDPCLIGCQREIRSATEIAPLETAPDVMLIDVLSDIYVPVVFPHQLHAQMEMMAGGCVVCHHHNPPDEPIKRCIECHSATLDESTELGHPSLKGAYHRQCLGCHREWSHETSCGVCHARRDPTREYDPTIDRTDIMGKAHPGIETPERWVYDTQAFEDGPVVTFRHKEHIDLFGLACTDCHKQESCARCHDTARTARYVRMDPHQDCQSCHDVTNDCAMCHTRHEEKAFDHGKRTRFPLKSYHEDLACAACHTQRGVYSGLQTSCTSCHGAEWLPTAFDHARVNLILDDLHSEIDCTLCHPGGLDQPVSCDTCHEPDIAYPAQLPGRRAE